MNKIKFEKGVSPAGIASWVCVVKPSVKFDKDGTYSVDLVVPEEAITDLRTKWEAQGKEALDAALAAEKDPKKRVKIKA